MIITDTSIDAFDRVALNIVGPLPETKNGNIYILTMQDDLTKYCMAVALKDRRSRSKFYESSHKIFHNSN